MEFVDVKKQEKVKRAAMLYLSQHETEKQTRFDVIEVVGEGFRRTIRHLENAFEDF